MIDKLERTILGTIIAYKDYQDIMISELEDKFFSYESHKLIFNCIKKLHEKGLNIDLITLNNEFNVKELELIGGVYYLASLTSNVDSGIHSDDHIRILKQEYIRKNLIELFQKQINDLLEHNHDISDTQIEVSKNLDDLFNISSNDMHNAFDVIQSRLEDYSNAANNNSQILGLKTGHTKLDKVTNGWQPGDLIIIGARPSMGKTAISLLFAKFQALQGKKVLFFSLEMSKERLIDRILSLELNINSLNLQNGRIEDYQWEQLDIHSYKFKDKELLINDESGLSVEQIKAYCLKEMTKKNIDLIVIDYLQLIKLPQGKESTNDKVGHISRSLKGLGKKCNCPVIALAQLNRAVEHRSGDKRPLMADLRDSGNIEQDADIIGFLHRPEYYGILEDSEGNSTKNIIEFLIAKNRNGALGSTYFYKSEDWSYIGELSHEEFESLEPPF